ncbi:FMN-linked oxidoreductase [Athelia psychrophila]|uniref:FMN-linked oxidoreductase n=1 Tax=Athelia psychrophila TaxID=1759441 RepID=A0A167T3Z5_9AGAM|nr:FMN-linked oxidoreductase [Fibularhizoctonia sp. CBS 109695]KZP33442.1 FMN-linked oxidoreductase [Fibularhizoctonia sp. CBS 109695]
MSEYYVQWVKGGAGLIISEGALITQQQSQQHIDGWKKITEAVHHEGAKLTQFLKCMARTDSYGGSIENRGLEALAAVVDVWGSEQVANKLTPAAGGHDVEMPLKETLETFTHFIQQADKLDLIAALLISGDLSPEECASLIASRQMDAAIFGRPWICQPDVGTRIAHGIALESKIDMKHIYLQQLDGSDAVDEVIRRGYMDYPAAAYT